MRSWAITYNDNTCHPEIVSELKHQDTPRLVCSFNAIQFFVEFNNRTDHAAASYGKAVNVEVISNQRTKRFKGTAVNSIIDLQ